MYPRTVDGLVLYLTITTVSRSAEIMTEINTQVAKSNKENAISSKLKSEDV